MQKNDIIFNDPAGTLISQAELQRRINIPDILMVQGLAAGVQATKNENWFTQQYLSSHGLSTTETAILLPEMHENVLELAAAYQRNGHRVCMLDATPGNLDGHYSTDSNKTFQRASYDREHEKWKLGQALTIFPMFVHTHRQPEVLAKKEFFRGSTHHLYQMQNPMEFGDTRIILRHPGQHIILAGLAENCKVTQSDTMITIGRSTRAGHIEFEKTLQEYIDPTIRVYTVALRQPFYHMDTTGIPGTRGEFFTTRHAYTDESWELLKTLFGDGLIELPLADIRDAFAGNGTCFGNNIYVSDKISDWTADLLKAHGYKINKTSIRHTIHSGGGHRCMTSACYTVMI